MMARWTWATLRDPVDAAALGVFRIAFGAIMLVEIARFFAHGWIRRHYLEPAFLFTYPGFAWIGPWPGVGLHAHVAATGLCAAMVAVGLWYRAAIVGLFLGFAYVFLLDQASYLNQYYLALCVALILCLVPAERAFSIDARRAPAIAPVVPRWAVLGLRAQFELMLIHAGLVKLNADWLRGQPLGLWLSERSDLPIVGPWLALPGLAVAAAHGVVILHLVGAPLLLLRRTRLAVFVLYGAFHLASAVFLRIGMFSWLTLAGTLMFFDPAWPRAVWRRLGGEDRTAVPAPTRGPDRSSPAVVALLTAFLLCQLVLPLRSLLYSGNVAWTRQGEWFSWRMKLHDSRASARFIVTAPGRALRWEVDPREYLSSRQVEMMAVRPDLILQFAHFLRATWAAREGVADAEVRAVVHCALNGRPPAPLIDPARDLARIPTASADRAWILPLTVPLGPRR